MRLLRTYERVAHVSHWCDRCCSYINPGEMYEGRVELYENRAKYRLQVFKTHINPACEEPPDPEDEMAVAETIVLPQRKKFNFRRAA